MYICIPSRIKKPKESSISITSKIEKKTELHEYRQYLR